METVSVNLLAVLVAGIIHMVIGGIWYAPPVFGNLWMKLSGIKHSGKSPAPAMIVSFVAGLVMAYILGVFVELMDVTDVAGALLLAFWIWLGFVASIKLIHGMFDGISLKLYALLVIYDYIVLAAMAVVLALWK